MASRDDPGIVFSQALIICQDCSNKAKLFCKNCEVNLCRKCVGQHMLSPPLKEHDVIKYSHKHSGIPKIVCPTHREHRCDLNCQECHVPICIECIASMAHSSHKIKQIAEIFEEHEDVIVKETVFLEGKIAPEYVRIMEWMKRDIRDLPKNNVRLKSKLSEQARRLHSTIDRIVNKRCADLDVMMTRDVTRMKKSLLEFQNLLDAIRDVIQTNKELLKARRSEILSYQSKIDKFTDMPLQSKIRSGSFTPAKIRDEEIYSLLGNLSPPTTTISEQASMKQIKEQIVRLQFRQRKLLTRPKLTATIDTEYKVPYEVNCIGNDQAWVSGNTDALSRVNSAGSVLERVRTPCGSSPYGLAVTKDGDLLYTDNTTQNVYVVKNGKVEALIRTQGYPSGICSTSAGDIFVALSNQSYTEYDWNDSIRVGKYCGASLTQEMQFDENNQQIFENGYSSTLRITENINGDFCYVDYNANEVIIISPQGNVKSTYACHNVPTGGKTFGPHSITTDRQGHILVSDFKNACIHILNMDGRFLSAIECGGSSRPLGVSVDSEDRLWVVEGNSRKLIIIQYLD